MKTIRYRGVLVVFRLQEHWVEEYEPDGDGTLDDVAVTLRLNVMTREAPRDLREDDPPASA